MPRPTLALLALVSIFVASSPAPVSAQGSHPDFSGTWVLDPSKSQAPGLPASGQLVVTQSDKLLSIEHTVASGAASRTNKLSYNIDGTPSKNSMNGPGGAPLDFNSTTVWDGNTLVITTTANLQGGMKQVERWSLSNDGKQLTVLGDITLGSQSATAKMLYDKK